MSEPTKEEIADVYNSIRCAWAQCEKIYGADSETIASVLNHWVKCEKNLKQISDETWYLGTKSDELEEKLKAVTDQRDRLAEILELFLNRVQYTSAFMDGELRGGKFDYRSSGFDAEVKQAYQTIAAVKGGSNE